MKKKLLIVLACAAFQMLKAQTTDDVRNVFGEGPYPFYITVNGNLSSNQKLFTYFVDDYIENKKSGETKSTLHGYEINVGWAFTNRNAFSIKHLNFIGFAVEIGYLTAARRTTIDGNTDLMIVENLGTARIAYRFNDLFPLTFQVHAGLNYYDFYQIREVISVGESSTANRFRHGTGLLEKTRKGFTGWFPGMSLGGRIAFFDPSGAGSGIGGFIEYSFHRNRHRETYEDAYNFFLIEPDTLRNFRRRFHSYSIGIVAPIAIRI